MQIELRKATREDSAELRAMQALSFRVLGAADYAPEVIEAFIAEVGTMDDSLIDDGTYRVTTVGGEIVGCGGWSTRRPGYARGSGMHKEAEPVVKVRSIYVHPDWARRGIASRIMAHLEAEIAAAGHERATLAATLTGVPFYARIGYVGGQRMRIELGNGLTLPVVAMEKRLPARHALSDAA